MTEVVAPPEPISRGTYAIYETPGGGRVLAYREEGEEESQQFHFPAPMIRIIQRVQAGEKINPMEMMRAVMGK